MITEIAITAALASLVTLAILQARHRKEREKSDSEKRSLKQSLELDLSRALEERETILDALGDAFLLVDSTAVIRFANTAARDLFGGRELIRRPVLEAFLDPRVVDPLMRCVETGEAVQSRLLLNQHQISRSDSESRSSNAWIIDAARLPSLPGEDSTTRVIIRDVTTEYQTEQVRKDFVANASHELRTPMAIINGYLENLLDDDMLRDPDTTRHFLSIMRKHSDRISRIIEDMLVISRLESGEINTLKMEPFKLRACVKDVIERLESLVRTQNAEIAIQMPDSNTVIHGDRFYWTQVLFNLVENALKQNPHPGLRVEIGCETTAETTRIWVADNGVGIPAADLPHIFRRFYRVEKHHSQKEIKGTGLGLSIVKRAIEAHGGTIGVTSVPGRETKFLIVLPRHAVPPA